MNIRQKLTRYLFSSFFAASLLVIPSVNGEEFFFYEEETVNSIPPFALFTVPKAGSHMVIKALHFLTGSKAIWHTKFPSVFYIPGDEAFLYTHLCLSPELEEDYRNLPLIKKIIMIRDLRDVCISMVSQIRKAPWPGLSGEQRKEFLSLSFDDQLLFVINFDYDVHEVASYAPNSLQTSILQVAKQAQKYSQDPSNLTCRYENLVGPFGGGTEEAQVEEVAAMAKFLNVEVTKDRLEEIASSLYGNKVDVFGKESYKNFNSTFQHGKIGRWQTLFKEEHKIAFKEKLGDLLIDLGYENDNNW